MRSLIVACTCLALVTSMSFAQELHHLAIGSGAGSLDIEDISSWGNFRDAADFDNGTVSGLTVWNCVWMLRDVTNSASYFMDRNFIGAEHTSNRVADGTVAAPSSTEMTNTGMTFPNTANLSCDLDIQLSQPTPGDTAQVTWTWAFNNSGGAALDLRFVWFIDGDLIMGGDAYNNDLVAIVPSDYHSSRAAVMGEDAGGGVLDPNRGLKIDCETATSVAAGLSNNTGPSYWWSNNAPYAGLGPEVTYAIVAPLADAVENDADVNYLADAQRDSGMALQADFTVPATGSNTVVFHATWGLNGTYSSGTLPAELSVFSAN
jgi:hypothetical protein